MHAPFEPTADQRRQVRTMTGLGIRQVEIALIVGCDAKTLRLHFRRELDIGATEANCRVAQALFSQATTGNVAAAIFWLKARAGWREKQAVEVSGPGGVAVSFRWADASVESTEAADNPDA